MLLSKHDDNYPYKVNLDVHIVHPKYNTSMNGVNNICDTGYPRLACAVWEGQLIEVTCKKCLKILDEQNRLANEIIDELIKENRI